MSHASKKKETVFPSEIIDAIKYARKKNPSDKFGDGAFRLTTKNIRNGNNGTRWMSFQVLKKQSNGKWDYVPILLRNINLLTTARIKTEEEKKESKQDYPGIYLQFNGDSSFERNLRDRSGKITGTKTEPYGKAKQLIAKAFRRLATAAIKGGDFYIENQNVKLNVQFHRWVNKAAGKKEALEKPICRVKVPFDGEGKNLTNPRIKIYDVEQKDPAKKSFPNYKEATVDDMPLDYYTIRKFIRCSSATSFIEDLSGVCLSSQGMSNPSKVKDFLIVKKGRGRKIEADDVFDANDFADIEGAQTGYDEDGDDKDEDSDEVAGNTEKVEEVEEGEFDDFADALDAEGDGDAAGDDDLDDPDGDELDEPASGDASPDASGGDDDGSLSDDLDELDDDL